MRIKKSLDLNKAPTFEIKKTNQINTWFSKSNSKINHLFYPKLPQVHLSPQSYHLPKRRSPKKKKKKSDKSRGKACKNLQGKAVKKHYLQLTLKCICDVKQSSLRSAGPQKLHQKISPPEALLQNVLPTSEMTY